MPYFNRNCVDIMLSKINFHCKINSERQISHDLTYTRNLKKDQALRHRGQIGGCGAGAWQQNG